MVKACFVEVLTTAHLLVRESRGEAEPLLAEALDRGPAAVAAEAN